MEKLKSPPQKSEMLGWIRTERARLQALLDTLSNDEIGTPNVQGEWSVKDMLAHIAAWERLAMARLDSAFNDTPLAHKPISSDDDVNEFNAKIYAENKERSLIEIWTEFDASYQAFIKMIEVLDQEAFAGEIPAAWASGKGVWELIGENTCWHYPEHSEAIEAWLS
jgi:hypothetical protein